jgi:hypothetical protein
MSLYFSHRLKAGTQKNCLQLIHAKKPNICCFFKYRKQRRKLSSNKLEKTQIINRIPDVIAYGYIKQLFSQKKNFEPKKILIKWHKEIEIWCEIGNHIEVDLPNAAVIG